MRIGDVTVGDTVRYWWVTDSPQTWTSDEATVIKVTAKRVRIRMNYPLGGTDNQERTVHPTNLRPTESEEPKDGE